VRLRDPRPRLRRGIALIVIAAGVLIGAATLAATSTSSSPFEQKSTPSVGDDASTPHAAGETTTRSPVAPSITKTVKSAEKPPRDARFHDPYYVFTEGPVDGVDAYPLADPPGIVVNLRGATLPSGSADELVGSDPRVRAVRRRATADGLRYILRVTTPIKRIEVTHEGNVVIVAPIR
jgi:hypothetical protein